ITIDGKPYHGAVFTDTAKGVRVFYEVDNQYKHWTFWNNGGEVNWACAEPQTWAINAPNLKLPTDVTGFQAVAPGATWSATSRVYVK
ncbi:MAG: aldose 1-epimerase, partial [Rikenellaceae bacterium]|nr:aldose 1-epimerase [Rikenellaceae bacterium]